MQRQGLFQNSTIHITNPLRAYLLLGLTLLGLGVISYQGSALLENYFVVARPHSFNSPPPPPLEALVVPLAALGIVSFLIGLIMVVLSIARRTRSLT